MFVSLTFNLCITVAFIHVWIIMTMDMSQPDIIGL